MYLTYKPSKLDEICCEFNFLSKAFFLMMSFIYWAYFRGVFLGIFGQDFKKSACVSVYSF